MEKTMGHLHDMCIELILDVSPPLWQIKKLNLFMRFFKKTGTEWEIASEIAISRDLDLCGIFSGSRDEFNGLDQAYLSHAGWGGHVGECAHQLRW